MRLSVQAAEQQAAAADAACAPLNDPAASPSPRPGACALSQSELPLTQRLAGRCAGRSDAKQGMCDAVAAAGGGAAAAAPPMAVKSSKPNPNPSLLVANMGAGEVAGVPDSPVSGVVDPALHGGAACPLPLLAGQPGVGAAGTPQRPAVLVWAAHKKRKWQACGCSGLPFHVQKAPTSCL